MRIALFRFATLSCVLDKKGLHDLFYTCLVRQLTFFLGSKSMSPFLALHLGGVLSKGEHLLHYVLFFLFWQKGGEFILNLFLIFFLTLAYHIILAKTSFNTNFIRLNTKTSDLLINKVYVLSSTKRERLLIQISSKNVIYILRSLLSFVNDKVWTLAYSKTSL